MEMNKIETTRPSNGQVVEVKRFGVGTPRRAMYHQTSYGCCEHRTFANGETRYVAQTDEWSNID